MKAKNLSPFIYSTIILAHLSSPSAHAQNLLWDSNGDAAGAGATPTGTWGVDPYWNTTGAGDVTTPTNATTTFFNDLFFSAGTDAVNAYTVNVSGTQNAKSIFFQDGAPTLSGGSIILSTGGGVTVNSSAAVAGATISSNLTISGRTTFAIGAGPPQRTLNLSTGTFTRNPGATLLINSGGILKSTMTNLSANTNGIVAPWVFYLAPGTGGTTRYASFTGSEILPLTGTAAATAANVTDTTGAANYDLAAAGTLGANASISTLRYTGAAGTITTNGTFKLNGLLNNTSSALVVSGDLSIGSTNELVMNNIATTGSTGMVTFSGVISDNGANPSALTKTGSGVLTLSGNNTYTGITSIAGTASGIIASSNNALGTAAGNTTIFSSGQSLGFSGGINYSTAETIIGSGVGTTTAVAGSFTAVQRGFVQSASGNNTFAGAIQINAGGTLSRTPEIGPVVKL
jgi:autotransporter-associated beta strand protein